MKMFQLLLGIGKKRLALLFIAIVLLVLIYSFQQVSYFDILNVFQIKRYPNLVFVINKSIRLVLNDFACLLIIYALFQERKYLVFGSIIQLIEVFILMPIYFIIKLRFEGDSEISSPLLSQIHRLIVNPVLMLLFITGLLLQKYRILNASDENNSP